MKWELNPSTGKVSKFMLWIIGFFVPGEIVEMYYQYNRDFVFDSSKFEQRFSFTPTPYTEGIKKTVEAHNATTEDL